MALGLIVCFISGGGGQQRYYHRYQQNCEPLIFSFFLLHVLLLFPSLGRGKKEGGEVTWYLLVAIPQPPDTCLSSPGMMGVLDVAGRQERCSAKTYTTKKCLCWKKKDFSKASPIVRLVGSTGVLGVLNFVVIVSSILAERPASLPC